jgi:SAM-dependent methyltransferase
MKEHYYDGLLNIKTGANQKGFSNSLHYHRYEPTPYSALEILLSQYELLRSDQLIDFGCGKGRLNFYVHHFFHASVVGIEMNEKFYHEAVENRTRYLRKHKKNEGKVQFHFGTAEQYPIKEIDNKFYFFNPFSVQIFMQVINNILLSVEQTNRQIELILYYPSSEYIYYLENNTAFEMIKEVTLPEYNHNSNEKFLIYRLGSVK